MSDWVSRFLKDIPPNLILAAWLALLVPPSPPPKPTSMKDKQLMLDIVA